MYSLIDIKRLERKTQLTYIHNLYERIPKEPITGFDFELEKTLLFDIRRAERELREQL